MPAILLPILLWILAHPQETEEAVAKALEAAIGAWRRWQAGMLNDEELQAEWTALGIKVDEVNIEWLAAEH